MEYKFVKESFNEAIFLNDLSTEAKDLIIGLKYEGSLLTIYTEQPITEIQKSLISGFVDSHNPLRSLTSVEQFLKDKERFKKRYESIGEIMSTMAAGNMERVRTGVWTTSQLISLTQDDQLDDILNDIYSVSFEIAHTKIDLITNELITNEIKESWKALLYENFYL